MAFIVLDPTETPRPECVAATTRPRLAELRGARVGLLANGKTNAATLLGLVGEILEREHGARVVRREDKREASRPAPVRILERFDGEVDLVVTAIGD